MRREKVILLSIGRPDVHHPLFRGEGRATEAKKGALDFLSKYRGRPPEVAGSNPASPSLGFLGGLLQSEEVPKGWWGSCVK